VLIQADTSSGCYRIALNNASDGLELMSDLSYLAGARSGTLTFDFTHMAAPLTQEVRDEYLPGKFGYQPTRQLVEVTACIGTCASQKHEHPHLLTALLPNSDSRVGSFLVRMELHLILSQMGLQVEFAGPANKEFGDDDSSRQNLIPLVQVNQLESGLPDFAQLGRIRSGIERVFSRALPNAYDLASSFTSIVQEAVDNLIEYGNGGIIGGLYYPHAGEVEISLANRCGGFGGTTPTEALEALIAACERNTRRATAGGNGIAELSRLANMCFGTLVLRNGPATLHFLPDGSIKATSDETGLSTPGATVTILLQLLPIVRSSPSDRTEIVKNFETVLRSSIALYRH
jgi:hypothetical protein